MRREYILIMIPSPAESVPAQVRLKFGSLSSEKQAARRSCRVLDLSIDFHQKFESLMPIILFIININITKARVAMGGLKPVVLRDVDPAAKLASTHLMVV
jgi:hypothetical protein